MLCQFSYSEFNVNISGNRRFRFIIALNLDRYRYAIDRSAKSRVVNSIVKQVQQLEGRFLERCDEHGACWLPVSSDIARRKVSHALRDKFPMEPLQKSFGELKARIKLCFVKCNVEEDRLYDKLNMRVLQALLPNMDHASDAYIENLLTYEVEQFISSLLRFADESSAQAKQVMSQMELHSIAYSECLSHDDDNFQTTEFQFEVFMGEIDCKARNNSCNDLGFNEAAANVEKSEEREVTNKYTSCHDLNVHHSFSKDKKPDIAATLLDDLLVDAEGKVHPIVNSFGDLPQGFTANDCEKLLASLDHLSNLVE
jgi:hypothetical protein